jgi:hypothetical protein
MPRLGTKLLTLARNEACKIVEENPRLEGARGEAVRLLLMSAVGATRTVSGNAMGCRSDYRMSTPSHCQIEHIANLLARRAHGAATASCHVGNADGVVTIVIAWRTYSLHVYYQCLRALITKQNRLENRLFLASVGKGLKMRHLPQALGFAARM